MVFYATMHTHTKKDSPCPWEDHRLSSISKTAHKFYSDKWNKTNSKNKKQNPAKKTDESI